MGVKEEDLDEGAVGSSAEAAQLKWDGVMLTNVLLGGISYSAEDDSSSLPLHTAIKGT